MGIRRDVAKASAESKAAGQREGVEPLLLALIDEVRALRKELAEARQQDSKR